MQTKIYKSILAAALLTFAVAAVLRSGGRNEAETNGPIFEIDKLHNISNVWSPCDTVKIYSTGEYKRDTLNFRDSTTICTKGKISPNIFKDLTYFAENFSKTSAGNRVFKFEEDNSKVYFPPAVRSVLVDIRVIDPQGEKEPTEVTVTYPIFTSRDPIQEAKENFQKGDLKYMAAMSDGLDIPGLDPAAAKEAEDKKNYKLDGITSDSPASDAERGYDNAYRSFALRYNDELHSLILKK